MNTAEIRQRLHQFIDTADDNNVNALFDYIEKSKNSKYTYSPEEVEMFHQQAEKIISGEIKMSIAEQTINYIRNKRKR